MSSIYILKNNRWIPWGYEQYPQDGFTIFKYMFQMAHGNEQIMICREESNLYYAYVLKLSNGERVGIGLVSNKISNDYYNLLKSFRSILKQLSDEELVIVKNSKLKLVLSKESFKEKHVNLDIFIRTHKLSINGESIPVAEIDVPKDDVVRCELGKKSSSWIVEQIKAGYHKVFITVEPSSSKPFNFHKLGKVLGAVLAIPLFIYGLSSMLRYCTNSDTDKGVAVKVGDNKVESITTSRIKEDATTVGSIVQSVPQDYIYVPSGMLRRYFDHYDDNYNNVYKDWAVDSFYICKFEVIQMDFETVMGKNPSKYKEDSIPVHGITIFDAVLYCNKKSEAEGFDGFYEIDSSDRVKLRTNGNGYRLPTDHEWALAARSGDSKTTKYAAGNNLKEIAWYGGNSGNKPHKVGTKQPNGRGLYDMNGNVLELCLFDDGKVWGKGSSFNLYISFEEETGIGYGGTLSSKKSQGEDMGMRLVFIPKR